MIKNPELDTLVYNAGFDTYEKLARYMEVTNATIYSWRAGRTLPRFDKAIKLADALGVEPRELLKIMVANNWSYRMEMNNE